MFLFAFKKSSDDLKFFPVIETPFFYKLEGAKKSVNILIFSS